MDTDFMTIGFVGFGLIGGSIAKAIKSAHPEYKIIVTSRSLAPVQAAKDDGIADEITDKIDSSFGKCDFIILCTPVSTISSYLKQLKNVKKASCIITDVGSVKGAIHKAAEAAGLSDCFIGGHPMAGSELSGYKNSSAELLKNAKYVITTTCSTKNEQLYVYEKLVKDMGAVPIIMDYTMHDYSVAGISHLPHLAAAALTKVVKDSDNSSQYMHLLAAGGFKDTTRIAASSPEMWSQICETNGQAICEMLDAYINQLIEIRNHININNSFVENSTNNTDNCSGTDNHNRAYSHSTHNASSLRSDMKEYIEALFEETRNYRNTF